jgi:hypothetical protein
MILTDITCPHEPAIRSLHFDTISLSKKPGTISLERCYVQVKKIKITDGERFHTELLRDFS